MLFQHVKTKHLYRIQMLVTRESDLETLVIYSDHETGTLWSRPASEFFDGRFKRQPEDPASPDAGYVQ